MIVVDVRGYGEALVRMILPFVAPLVYAYFYTAPLILINEYGAWGVLALIPGWGFVYFDLIHPLLRTWATVPRMFTDMREWHQELSGGGLLERWIRRLLWIRSHFSLFGRIRVWRAYGRDLRYYGLIRSIFRDIFRWRLFSAFVLMPGHFLLHLGFAAVLVALADGIFLAPALYLVHTFAAEPVYFQMFVTAVVLAYSWKVIWIASVLMKRELEWVDEQVQMTLADEKHWFFTPNGFST